MKNSVFLVLCFGLFSSYQVLGKPNPATDEDLEDYNNDDLPDTDDPTGDPVSIISQPRNFTINIGSTVKLPCHLNGDIEEATVQWKFNSRPLFFHLQRQTANNRTTIATDFTVTVEHAMPEDSGYYECSVLGEVIPGQDSLVHHVAVVSSPRIVQVIPSHVMHEVTPGAPFTFMCDAVGTPTPHIFWIKQLKGSNSTETIKESKISYDKVESSHSGKYTCVARNKNGEDSRSIEFVVLSPPVITPLRPVVATSKGYESELICKSEPNVSPPQVHWLKDGHRIKNDNRYTITVDNNSMDRQYILRIAATKEEDYGTYECVGKNNYGESVAKVELTGKPLKPVFVNGNPKENGHELTFFIESKIGFENYEMAYKRQQDDEWETTLSKYSTQSNAVELTHAFSQDLTPDTYEAKIRVQNANGWSEWSDVQYFPGRKGGSKKSNDVVQSKLLESSVIRGAASSLSFSIYLPVLLTVALYSMLHCKLIKYFKDNKTNVSFFSGTES